MKKIEPKDYFIKLEKDVVLDLLLHNEFSLSKTLLKDVEIRKLNDRTYYNFFITNKYVPTDLGYSKEHITINNGSDPFSFESDFIDMLIYEKYSIVDKKDCIIGIKENRFLCRRPLFETPNTYAKTIKKIDEGYKYLTTIKKNVSKVIYFFKDNILTDIKHIQNNMVNNRASKIDALYDIFNNDVPAKYKNKLESIKNLYRHSSIHNNCSLSSFLKRGNVGNILYNNPIGKELFKEKGVNQIMLYRKYSLNYKDVIINILKKTKENPYDFGYGHYDIISSIYGHQLSVMGDLTRILYRKNIKLPLFKTYKEIYDFVKKYNDNNVNPINYTLNDRWLCNLKKTYCHIKKL